MPSRRNSEEYEYLPPHGSPSSHTPQPNREDPYPKQSQWEVTIPWKSETIRKTVWADSERKALNKVVVEMSKSMNLQMNLVFRTVLGQKKFTVIPVKSSFLARASSANIS